METGRIVTPWEMPENSPVGIDRNHTRENERKVITRKCQNGKYTHWKIT